MVSPRGPVNNRPGKIAVVNKALLLQQIIATLTAESEGYARSARAAHSEATDEQSRAENKYDTRGLEASYLARGQSRQALEVIEAIQHFGAMGVRQYAEGQPADLGALLELQGGGERIFYFIGPRSGGMEVMHEGHAVLVITPQSPLGQQLVGKKIGDRLRVPMAGPGEEYRVAAIY
jgi:hypothetical protein